MTANELYALEYGNKSEIHLFLAGNFWQAWEKSAFFFYHYFEKYQVHTRFVKKISAEMLYLGFPKTALSSVVSKAENQKYAVNHIDQRHVVITGFVQLSGFESWKKQCFENACKPAEKNSQQLELNFLNEENKEYNKKEYTKAFSVPEKNILLASKEFYESTKYIFTRTGETAKLYRYGLGDKLRGDCLDFLDHLHCVQLHAVPFDGRKSFELFCRIRIKLRMLLDFRQISEKQWFFINEKIEKIKNLLRLESFGLRSKGECLFESGDTLAPC